MIVHLCAKKDWEAALGIGSYRAQSLDVEGFIHCSRPDQLLEVANNFYRYSPPLVVLWIIPSKVDAKIIWESVGQDNFPHIYGPLNLNAVEAALDFPPESDGIFRILPQPEKPSF